MAALTEIVQEHRGYTILLQRGTPRRGGRNYWSGYILNPGVDPHNFETHGPDQPQWGWGFTRGNEADCIWNCKAIINRALGPEA